MACRKLADYLQEIEQENNQLKADNARLRELVRMMLRVAGVAEYATNSEWQIIIDYLHEFGVEVD